MAFTKKCKECGFEGIERPNYRWHKCPKCKRYNTLGIVFGGYIENDSDTEGYAGYNLGLDTVIENRGHYKRVIKEKNVIPIG